MNKEFIPYEQALALKELGFNEPCLACVDENGFYLKGDIRFNSTTQPYAPLYQQAFRWFKKTHKLKFYIREDIWNNWCEVKVLFNQEYVSVEDFDSYDKAELACLKKLIEIVKK